MSLVFCNQNSEDVAMIASYRSQSGSGQNCLAGTVLVNSTVGDDSFDDEVLLSFVFLSIASLFRSDCIPCLVCHPSGFQQGFPGSRGATCSITS